MEQLNKSKVVIEIVNLKELEDKLELVKKLIKEIKGFKIKFKSEIINE